MASTILVQDLLWGVSTQLLDTRPQFTRWTEWEMVRWLSEAQRCIAKYLPVASTRLDALRLTAGSRQSISKILAANMVPGDGSAPRDVSGNLLLGVTRNMGADGLTPGNVIRLVDRDILDAVQPNWPTKPGQPVTQYTFDPRTPAIFHVVPPVPSNTTLPYIEVEYLADPAAIPYQAGQFAFGGPSTTTISLDDMYADDLHNYVMAKCFLKDVEFAGNATLFQTYGSLFTNSLNQRVAASTGENPNLNLTVFSPTAPAAAN